MSVSQRNAAGNEKIIKVSIESLEFQNRFLNGSHSISDIKFPC